MRKRLLLDLYCGGGGAALGYLQSGLFEVVGVDTIDQPGYPGTFVKSDATTFLREYGGDFDAVHASPPCPRASRITPVRYRSGWVDWIAPTRHELQKTGKPWVIENVPGAVMRRDLELCGTQFGLPLYRHRLFETSWGWVVGDTPAPCVHDRPTWYPWDKRRASYGTEYEPGFIIPVHGDNNAPADLQFMAMGIGRDQMSRKQMIKAIPPAFTKFIAPELEWRCK